MCDCPGKETAGCISEYVCPLCGTRWYRDKTGNWEIRWDNPYLDGMAEPVEPEDWELPIEKREEPWSVMPGD